MSVISRIGVLCLSALCIAPTFAATKTVLGHKMPTCKTEGNAVNYCTKSGEAHLKKVLATAEKIPANFDNNKVLVGYQHKRQTDVFVLDKKTKTLYLFPHSIVFEGRTGAPSVVSDKSSDWFCFPQDDAIIEASYVEGYVSSFSPPTSKEFGQLACAKFKNGKFIHNTAVSYPFSQKAIRQLKQYDANMTH